jgi:SagB-type dehydrogenase family enzyme
MNEIERGRQFLKSDRWDEWEQLETDQRRRVPLPAVQKPCETSADAIALVAPNALSVGDMSVLEAIRRRRSHRRFVASPLSLEELSFLLWATQGVQELTRAGARRTVPSAGSRHPFETYLAVRMVTGLCPGLYRYLPLDHALCPLGAVPEMEARLVAGCCDQRFVGQAAVTFIWSAVPYRTEWRYSVVSHKVIAMDAGHLCQNLYLACESINAGTCAIGAFEQELMDALIAVDGVDEFVIYVAPVGKIA